MTVNLDNPTASVASINPVLANYKTHPAYSLFISALRSKHTKIKYDGCLQKYLRLSIHKSLDSLDQVLQKNSKVIESEITQQLIEMKNAGSSYSTVSVHLAALYHFFSINDVIINRKKLSKFLGEQENKYEYRSYTLEEISSLLSLSDERGKAIVLLMVSTGMRVGALPSIKLRHLTRHNLEDGKYVYRIQVYATSRKDSYFTFCTPECAKAIDDYLSYRKRVDRSLVQDMNTGNWGPHETYLFTKLFDLDESTLSSNSELYKEPMSALGLRAYIVKKLKKLNLRKEWLLTENSSVYRASHKNELHPCHSFRIFAITNMQRSKIDKTVREMLVGHSTGLDSAYYKPSEGEILQEYLKAVDSLTISNESRLTSKLSRYNTMFERLAHQLEDLDTKFERAQKNREKFLELLEPDQQKTFRMLWGTDE
ncbi:site-specific integrase [Candidatus Nitrosocosmicus arcticus]|uniref:Tyr recombinase domain-containing protein n=1 Tax=Candidatus Nitrosocosmicus arcticus TaxID=2035267 RepID=A0A557SVS9_9ARCH|nr:site-specific integrase [Candidatus Nitrosocosmicus arcticus]TVP40712.1 hypothetical protein NARC_60099 [Candidatus Nitrosocosmicus arcticus]